VKTAVTVLICVLVSIFIVFLLLENAIYRAAFYQSTAAKHARYHLPKSSQYDRLRGEMTGLVENAADVKCEEVYTESYDGLKLYARYYHIRDGAPLIIMFHGWKGGSLRDMAGAHEIARHNGYNILLVDERAHGNSDGHRITFGVKERFDVKSWVAYALNRFGDDLEIILSGVSMGGAVVLMASDLDLPENVKGIIADSAFASPKSIICRVSEDRGIASRVSWPFIRFAAKVFARFDPESASAVESVRHTEIPVLLIHGTADRFVPCEMSVQIRDSCASPCRLEIFEGAMHGVSYCIDRDRYTKAVLDFVRHVT